MCCGWFLTPCRFQPIVKCGKPAMKHHGSIKKVLAFLRDHPSQAYRRRELADTLLGTSFHVGELTDEEFTELQRSDELSGGDDYSLLADYINLRYIERALTRLEDGNFIEARKVTAEAFDLPHDETVIAYTYNGEADYEES